MFKFVIFLFLFPVLIFAQAKPKPFVNPKTTQSSNKPKPSTAKKPTTTKKPVTTKKPAVNSKPYKPSPAVIKLVEKAYDEYKNSKDKECEATIKKILALDPKNKDAYVLRANMAMFEGKKDVIIENLNKVYKYHPNSPDVYAQFAYTHMNYEMLSDSFKLVLIRKTIFLAPKLADGYAYMGMLAANQGLFEDAIRYFDVSRNKTWKDSASLYALEFMYSRCLYGLGEKQEAIDNLNRTIPKIKSQDRFYARYMRSTYIMENEDISKEIKTIQNDIDTLLVYAPESAGVLKLYADFLLKTNKKDSACLLAKKAKSRNEIQIDISKYCDDLVKTINVKEGKKLIYEIGDNQFIVKPTKFNYDNEISFEWQRGDGLFMDIGSVTMTKDALDTSITQHNYFSKGNHDTLYSKTSVWLSKKQFDELEKDSTTTIRTVYHKEGKFKIISHDQIEVLDNKDNSVYIDCIAVSDGEEVIWYLNDRKNPLIVKMALEKFTIVLSKFE